MRLWCKRMGNNNIGINMTVKFEITIQQATEVNIEDVAKSQGWTGFEPELDANGSQVFTADENGVPVLNMVAISASDFCCKVIMQRGLFPLYDEATLMLEKERGTLNYNAAAWAGIFKAATTVTRVE